MSRILHVLDHSLPEQSGYSFRSHAILRELAARVEIDAITSPKQASPKQGAAAEVEEIDGITYRRTDFGGPGPGSGPLGQLHCVSRTRRHIREHLAARPAALIHAHSPCLNGLAALHAGVPLLYEMRSSWEDAAVSNGQTTEGSLRYRASRALETFVAMRADAVVVICEGLKRELVARGIEPEKITVVPNAVPADMLEPAPAGAGDEIRRRFGLERSKVVGFFGSFFEWEGVDLLVRAIARVAARRPDVRLLLAGGGRQEAALRALVGELGIGDKVVFAGRIEHRDVPAFYAAADVMAYPRIAHRLTDMVTPLKPLEAMAQRAPVVASDVGGHRELVEDGETGFLFPAGDDAALAATLLDVLELPRGGVDRVIERARGYIERERRWSVVAERYWPVYSKLAGLEQTALLSEG